MTDPIDIWDGIGDNERGHDDVATRVRADALAAAAVAVVKPNPVQIRDWESSFRDGQLVPIGGWWFRVIGVVRERQPNGALVLEPTGEPTKLRRVR